MIDLEESVIVPLICISLLMLGACLCTHLLLALIGGLLTIMVCRLLWRPKVDIKGKAVLITGCDTGFGHHLAQRLGNKGIHVFAGCLDGQGEGAQKLKQNSSYIHPVQLDVTSNEQVRGALRYVKEEIKKTGVELWGLVNNAGVNTMGEVELCTMNMFYRAAEVNQFGPVRVTKAFLPLIRKSKGRVVNVTSVKGRQSLPSNAAYCMAKFALETFSDVLRMEMKQWGVKVVIVEPGNYGGTTGMIQMDKIRADFEVMWSEMDPDAQKNYGKEYVNQFVLATDQAKDTACMDLTTVINDMEAALTDLYPRIHYVPGGSTEIYDIEKWIMLIGQYIPTALLDYIKIKFAYKGFSLPKGIQSQNN